jgi:hypothetical protein
MARKSFLEMAGEGAREIGVLVFVFALLDGIIARRNTLMWTLVVIAVSSLFFGGGCYIELWRVDRDSD